MKKTEINKLLERLATALSAGDLKGVSACWTFPALFLSDADAVVLAEAGQLEKFMAQASEAYRKQGIASTEPELENVDRLSEKLVAVDVRWLSYDASGKKKGSERSHYMLHIGKDEQIHIRVALTRTK